MGQIKKNRESPIRIGTPVEYSTFAASLAITVPDLISIHRESQVQGEHELNTEYKLFN